MIVSQNIPIIYPLHIQLLPDIPLDLDYYQLYPNQLYIPKNIIHLNIHRYPKNYYTIYISRLYPKLISHEFHQVQALTSAGLGAVNATTLRTLEADRQENAGEKTTASRYAISSGQEDIYIYVIYYIILYYIIMH